MRVMPESSVHYETKPLTIAKASEISQTHLLAKSFKTLLPIAEEWENIGTLLELSQKDLDSIAADEAKVMNCLRQMLRLWLSQINDPSDVWQTLAEAVEPFDSQITEKLKSLSIETK